jgi:hypothetical protein
MIRSGGFLSTAVTVLLLLGLTSASCARQPQERRFATPEEAVAALIASAKAGDLDEVLALFGPEGKELVASSDPETARKNRDVFEVATSERWRLADLRPDAKELIVGNEDWPFPVPIVKDAGGWRFDTAAGKEEILARRIGRNELAVIGTCHAYVTAQRLFAKNGHDGKPAGLYAVAFRSDPGKQNGLYWPAAKGAKRSPLGDLVAEAATDGRGLEENRPPAPFHGYLFRILTAQGSKVPGGAKSYVVNGNLSGGFALVAWPAQYDASGVMTFVINQSGVVWQKDLGPETAKTVAAMKAYDPDASWTEVR